MLALRSLLLCLITSVAFIAANDIEAQSSSRRRAVGGPPARLDIYELAGYAPAIPTTDDLAPFGALVGDASVVGLGESWHSSGGFYLMKHRLFRYLVEENGFRAFAIESNWEAVERTNAYVQTCAGRAEDAIGAEHIVWQST